MEKSEILWKLELFGGIYGYMTGMPYSNHGKKFYELEKIIFFEKKDLHVCEDRFWTIHGYPGPDCMEFIYADHGKTWAFRRMDFAKQEPPAGMCSCEECIYQPMRWGPGQVSLPSKCPVNQEILDHRRTIPAQLKGYCPIGIKSEAAAIFPKYYPTPDDLYRIEFVKEDTK